MILEKHEVLKKHFGHREFREGQEEIINQILSGRDVLGIMPTGAGKSICYQVPALMMEGITLVISPLISLMQDQVISLRESGISAAYINSSLSAAEYFRTMDRAANSEYKIIYVAPERLSADDFLRLSENVQISMVTVDEAHCVSQWGQDFRPSYLKISEFMEKLAYRPVLSAFTATATKEVREDISLILRQNNPYVVTTGFDRKNLRFAVERPKKKDDTLIKLLKAYNGRSGIVYCSTRKNVEEVCDFLIEKGYSATRYHAGLSDEERGMNQDDFIYDRKTVMVATNAFGMGIDKSNVSFVIHYNMPKNLESYYQEAGRAGRDGEPAECTLLYSGADVKLNQFLIEKGNDTNEDFTEEMKESVREKDRERLKLMTFYCTTNECLREYMLRYFGEKTSSFCGNCSNCNSNFETVDVTTESQKIVSCVYRVAQRKRSFGRVTIIDILHGSKSSKIISQGLDTLSTYGIMSDVPVHRIRMIMDYLIEKSFLAQTDDEYSVVKLTAESADILKGNQKVSMKLPKEMRRSAEKGKASYSSPEYDINDKLFNELRVLRNQLAMEARVPAYIVFADAALRDMCRKMPVNRDEFLNVSGVGEAKAEKYSKQFTELIQRYKQ
ncbi:MAG: DNA helicase RecQ [Oscillospiraceae bacterium]|nr:DNA helicase RecQ [Oscillospiraceae bacterium]